MKKLCLVLSGYLLVGLICYSRLLPAKAYIPSENAEILRVGVPANINDKPSLAELETLVGQGLLINQSESGQGRLKRQLQAYYQQTPSPDIAYLYARVLQRQHDFSLALEVLTALLLQVPEHANARLLQANIFMTLGDHNQAKKSCLALTGHVEIAVIAICALDAISQALASQLNRDAGLQQLRLNYQTLIRLLAKDKEQPEELALWGNQVLAEMALRLNRPLAARQHLSQLTLAQAPVSLIALWADIELKLGNYKGVLTKLPSLVEPKGAVNPLTNLPDALLLRLALAEKKHAGKNIAKHKWQRLITERVKLREIRQDTYHAAELARYYLDINPVPEKAHYWARVNYRQTKMASDRALLVRAASAEFSVTANGAKP